MEIIVREDGKRVLKKCWSAQDVKQLNQVLKTVDVIGEMAFMSNWDLKETLKIPSNVTEIEVHAFSHCKNLKEVTIAGDNVVIGDFAFECCENLEKVTFEHASKIGAHAFRGCEKLKARSLKDGVKVGAFAFEGIESMIGVSIPGQDYIRDSAVERMPNEPKTDAELWSYIQKRIAKEPLSAQNHKRADNLIEKAIKDAEEYEAELLRARYDEDYVPKVRK